MAAVSSPPGKRSTRYRRRRPLPALLLILLLAAVAGVVWFNVLGREQPAGRTCPPPAGSDAPVGEVLPAAALDGVRPVAPSLVRVQVLNGNGQRGQAAIVSGSLVDFGFVPAADPANDPRYPGFDLACHGQIRFGAAGAAAARTLSVAAPCAQLVRDDRPGDVVDLALGTEFRGLAPSAEGRSVLTALARPGQPAPVDAERVAAARDVRCGPAV